MSILQCIIADDEPIARQILENYIQSIPNLELVASCKNAFEVMEILQKETVDILFLDINMPKLSGLSLLKTLQTKPNVIITTAYPEHAVEGFALSVTDYLLKPFSLERFIQAVLKVQQNKEVVRQEITTIEEKEVIKSIFIKSDKKILKLNFDDIFYVEAYGNYIKIYTDNMVLTPQTLSDFLSKIPDSFLRIHKSFVINFDHLKLIDGNQIILQNETKLPIGKSYRKDVLDKISNFNKS
ncbi:LytTR family DNA-binding domain-containing protein [Aquimarina sp. AU474]|uniref:LytR/AlgR family response regulator transcription factor n=1 Tax=Aquimarina sp. AU474 TaxID=2108529 RepID=UPI000D694018|nr:LytTR family DNA-binding domain-containing protein [Aquimarina sp. AU474]